MEQNGLKRWYIQVISNYITTELRTKGNLNTTGTKNIVILQNKSVWQEQRVRMVIVVQPGNAAVLREEMRRQLDTTVFRFRLRFWENRLWRFAKYILIWLTIDQVGANDPREVVIHAKERKIKFLRLRFRFRGNKIAQFRIGLVHTHDTFSSLLFWNSSVLWTKFILQFRLILKGSSSSYRLLALNQFGISHI